MLAILICSTGLSPSFPTLLNAHELIYLEPPHWGPLNSVHGEGQAWTDNVGDLGVGRGVTGHPQEHRQCHLGVGGAGLSTQVAGDNGRCPVPPHTFSGVVAPSGEAPARRDHSLSCQDTDLMVAGC